MIRYRVTEHPTIPGWRQITIDTPHSEPLVDYEGGDACEALLQYCRSYVKASVGEMFRMSCPKGWHHEDTDERTNTVYYRRGPCKVGVSVKDGMLLLSVSTRAVGHRPSRANRNELDRVKRDFVPAGSDCVVEAESPNRTHVRFICVAMPGYRLDTASYDFPVAVPIEATDA